MHEGKEKERVENREGRIGDGGKRRIGETRRGAVSYTHLTLPTNREV